MLAGFAAEGLPVSNPPSDRFISKLLGILAAEEDSPLRHEKEYKIRNAMYLLGRVPAERLIRNIDSYLKRANDRNREGLVKSLIDELYGNRWLCSSLLRSETCADILKRITGQDFGTDYPRWRQWYEDGRDE